MNERDWKEEARGLGYMILQIERDYRQAKGSLGGDSELLASSIIGATAYVDGPLREAFAAESAALGTQGREQ